MATTAAERKPLTRAQAIAALELFRIPIAKLRIGGCWVTGILSYDFGDKLINDLRGKGIYVMRQVIDGYAEQGMERAEFGCGLGLMLMNQ